MLTGFDAWLDWQLSKLQREHGLNAPIVLTWFPLHTNRRPSRLLYMPT